MDITTVTATRILKGQLNGEKGEDFKLAMGQFQHAALSKVRYIVVGISAAVVMAIVLSCWNRF